jgi:hypothetical protein
MRRSLRSLGVESRRPVKLENDRLGTAPIKRIGGDTRDAGKRRHIRHAGKAIRR